MLADAAQAARWEGRRADARRNCERVIAAALDVFAERGLDATMNDVAARAGVGKATVYRIFPTKGDLIAAIVLDRRLWLERRTAAALAEPDPAAALESLLADIFGRLLSDRAVLGLLVSPAIPGGLDSNERAVGNISRLLEAAMPAGAVRGDVTVRDVVVLLTGCAGRLNSDGVTDPATWQRYCDFVLRAIGP